MRLRSLLWTALLLLAASSATAQANFETPSGLGNAQREIALATGVTLEYEEQGRADGRAVVFLHGYIDSWFSFARIKPLLPKEVRAYFLTQRGHGDSSKPACCYEVEDYVADLHAFLDAKGIAKATLVGHSMGSFIAHAFAVSHPERVEGLVLLGSAPAAGNEVLLELDAYVQELEDIDRGFVQVFQTGTLCVPLPAEFLSSLVDESLKAPLHVWQGALRGLVADDHSARLGEITAPTLVIGGLKDPLFGPTEQLALAKAIPHAAVVFYSRFCHSPNWEEPQRFSEDLLQFLRERVWRPTSNTATETLP